MTLRPLSAQDLETVRRLRNDNRDHYFDSREITPEQQARWFAALAGKPVRFYVIEEGGAVVGTISVTDTPDGREIGNLVLDAAYRGRGLMTAAVTQLISDGADYFADVKPGNEPSLSVFRRAGFEATAVRMVRRKADSL